ncbi:hydantoinase/oxoprolinase family protein [Actinophytocola oryzae]|uniref:N-methylhydantoinase A n=1 Tax=Actinophytocola oryzae TaxID=502181 RepID=A0A4V6Q710_9PSEU|nr:hydantoinase/oxoprolinase family protein [Actinophytocola oryzae]TDV57841.1 N-methylhydantoinase A [Actinophytocola oryzae]
MDEYRVGVDVGGTFTDCVVVSDSGATWAVKARTTPEDQSGGVLDSVVAAAQAVGLPDVGSLLAACRTFVHGSTVATNVMVTRRGARTALLTTRGHEDAIRIGRGRQRVAGLPESRVTHVTHHAKPRPLVAPTDVVGLRERIDADGTVLVALDEKQVRATFEALVDSGVEALAVCLLWSITNPVHERRVREIAAEVAPDLYISLSSEVAPVLGEYERTTSTVVNSYVGPAVARYLTSLEERLGRAGLRSSILYTQADGGLAAAESVIARPLSILDSGPAAGVLGVASLAAEMTRQNVLCADVGGTTFDVGVVNGGTAEQDAYPVVDQYELRLPKVLIKSIGAGGGSIAWTDGRGVLRVGPQSAGAVPGPACYGNGGTQPTVTDAYLALGHLDPETPLASGIRPDMAAARAALSTVLGPERATPEEAAAAIVRIAENQMADLLHRVTMERGLDPRDFTLAVYGGAGPLFGAAIANIIGIDTVHVVPHSGAFSALGMLQTDLTWTAEESFVARVPMDPARRTELGDRVSALREQVTGVLGRHGNATDVRLRTSVGVRFALQAHHLDVELPGEPGDDGFDELVRSAFVARYRQTYGRNSAYEPAPVEVVYVRVVGSVGGGRSGHGFGATTGESTAAAPGERCVHFPGHGFTPARILDGAALVEGTGFDGPAIVHGAGETTTVPPGWHAGYTAGQLVLTRCDGTTNGSVR